MHNLEICQEKLLINASIDLWNQPKDLSFVTNNSMFGFGVKSEVGIRFAKWNNNNKSAYFNIGASYKTKGFIPEAPSLKEDFRMHFGFIMSVNK